MSIDCPKQQLAELWPRAREILTPASGNKKRNAIRRIRQSQPVAARICSSVCAV
jgi:hypothetical protein